MGSWFLAVVRFTSSCGLVWFSITCVVVSRVLLAYFTHCWELRCCRWACRITAANDIHGEMGCGKASTLSLCWALLTVTGAIPATLEEAQGCKTAERREGVPGGGCLNCDAEGRCRKCIGVIVYGSRECADNCPDGYHEEWSTLIDYMGRLCRVADYGPWWLEDGAGLTGRRLAVVVGTCSGLFISLLLLLGAFLYIRCCRAHQISSATASCKHSSTPSDSAGYGFSHRYPQFAWGNDEIERQEFIQQLISLQPEAPVFLAMLNDTRRKFRKIDVKNGKADSRCKAYRVALRDLCRILALLNQKEMQTMSIPGDWKKLLSWGERVLKRYKKQHSLVTAAFVQEPTKILQLPIQVHCEPPKDCSERNSSGLVSFQPNGKVLCKGFPRISSLEESAKTSNGDASLPGGNVSNTHFLVAMKQELLANRPRIVVDMVDKDGEVIRVGQEDSWSPEYGLTPDIQTPISGEWTGHLNWEYDVEDEFAPLGHRPQDEITTEL